MERRHAHAQFTFNSANLNENQNEQNYYGVVTYQKSAGDLNFQVAVFGRNSSVHFTPDPIGDLFFNGVASDVDRNIYSGGLQADASYELNDKHTMRGGLIALLDESVSADTTTTVFPMDAERESDRAGLSHHGQQCDTHGLFAGVYLQDEWKILPKVTLNYGARFDVFNSSFDNENQLSPRVNLIYQPTDSTTLHAGYARYFTPPPVENVSGSTRDQIRRHVERLGDRPTDSRSKPSAPIISTRASRQKVDQGLQVGVDGYYKYAKNQLDDGLFGQTLILSAFNYREGRDLWRGIHRLLHGRRLFHLRQRRLLAWRRAKTGVRRSSCSTRRTWPTSKITGSIWITTSS